MSKRPPGTLKLSCSDPATPERVAEAARLMMEAIQQAGADQAQFTFVVNNLEMNAEVRPQTTEARKALGLVSAVLDNPTRALEKNPASRGIAMALSKLAATAFPTGLTVQKASARKPITTLDEVIAKQLYALATAMPEAAYMVRGTSGGYSKVYRFGRKNDNDKQDRVRIDFEGRTVDMPVAEGMSRRPLLDALDSSGWIEFEINAVWQRTPGEDLVLRESHCVMTHAEPFEPVSGTEFLERGRQAFEIPADAVARLLRERHGDA